MTCTHDYVAALYFKHDDRACIRVPHLRSNHVGYMPYVGIFGGDDTSFEVCLDCGQILGWKPILDQEFEKKDEFDEDDC